MKAQGENGAEEDLERRKSEWIWEEGRRKGQHEGWMNDRLRPLRGHVGKEEWLKENRQARSNE